LSSSHATCQKWLRYLAIRYFYIQAVLVAPIFTSSNSRVRVSQSLMLRPKQDHVGRVDHAGAFDFVRPLDGHGELVRFRDNRGVALLDLHKVKAPSLRMISGLSEFGSTQSLGETGLMVNEPYNYVRATPRDYQVADISLPSEPVLLATSLGGTTWLSRSHSRRASSIISFSWAASLSESSTFTFGSGARGCRESQISSTEKFSDWAWLIWSCRYRAF